MGYASSWRSARHSSARRWHVPSSTAARRQRDSRPPCSASCGLRGRTASGVGSRRPRAGHAGLRGGTLRRCARRCGSHSMPTARSSRPRSPTSREFSYSWCCRLARSSRRPHDGGGQAVRRSDGPARPGPPDPRTGGPAVRPNRFGSRGRPAHRPDPSGLRPRHHASAARAPLAPGFALSGGAVHRRAHRDRRRCRRHQSPARGRRVRALGLGRLGARAAHAALFRAGRPRGDGASGGAAAARLPRFAAQAPRGLLGCPGLLRSEERRARVRLDPGGPRRRGERRRVQEPDHLLRAALCGAPDDRDVFSRRPDRRQSTEDHVGGRRLRGAGARRQERGPGGRVADPSQGDGLRRPRRTRHERALQGARRALRHAGRGAAGAAAAQDPDRRTAVRGGGTVTPRVETDTPLMQQYREIKARYPHTILFFRMGDFYEMFEDDARLAARELGLTLTSRNNGGAADVPLAGVAICEQVEDPKLAKGLVRREVVETVTPGTVLAEDWLERDRNNFLVALDPRSGGAAPGLAALDLTTGELALETVPVEDLASALARYEPPEVLLPAGCEVASAHGSVTVTEREAWEFDPELAREDLVRTFRLASLDGLGIEPGDRAAVGAAGALLRYARELKPGGLPHLARPRMLRRGDVLSLDEMTRRNLELVEPLRPGVAGATLLEVLDRTMTPLGARLLRRWLLAPLVDPAAINARLDAVDVLVADPRGRDRLREALDGVRDLERLAGRAALGRATPRELGALRDSIRRLPDVRAALDGLEGRERAPLLEAAAERFDLLSDLGDELSHALVDRPPAQLADGDAIRPGFDPELDQLKDARDGGKTYIAGLQARERERTGIGSLKVGFNRVFGYYLEITHAHRDRIPADYERRQTLTGAERYVTPELKEYEEKVLGAEERIAAREAAVIDGLRRRVADVIGRLQGTAVVIAELDVRAALADLAHREGYVRPEVT